MQGETNKAIETLEKSVLVFYDVEVESDLADPNLLFWYVTNLSILLLTKSSGFDQSSNFWGGVY